VALKKDSIGYALFILVTNWGYFPATSNTAQPPEIH